MGDFKEVWNLFDATGTGMCAADKFPTLLRAVGHNPTQAEIQELQAQVEKDGNIFFQDVQNLLQSREQKKTSHEAMVEHFKVFDKNGNGLISAAELKHVMMSLGDSLTEEEAAEMVTAADPQNSGQINYASFVTMLMGN
mmetsp:Transcript_46482/g.91468  ORF Transcript_46482/g.91468 Transcript_46482/m.91468 type:complete len:139 (-) Transcript_46482:174-590(-)|eukprot:CAMPEP_0175137396 /NCGR_PEP_ID=MMETSP0087-20121206/9790_1 /TAXON_ID=136419 /ORGANISM="Unknown Unknown, Strain D1" /LENGTH=138 /DNA_ID=CAMNT_0016420223 /DNA_START=32 /DNA_END=448 /DNA_ORIENTATION=+